MILQFFAGFFYLSFVSNSGFVFLKLNFAHSEKMSNFVRTLGVSANLQTETLPFEPDLDYTSVGKSK